MPSRRELAGDGILIIDAADRIAYCSAAAAALFGRPVEELTGAPVGSRLDGLPPAGAEGTARLLRGDGDWIAVHARVERWKSGARPFCILFLEDMEDRRSRLSPESPPDPENARRMESLRRVAASMAHEFNNVLAGIGSFADYLNRRGPDDETRTAATQINKAIRRGKSVTDEILRFTRIRPPELEVVDVHAWLEAFLPEANAITGGRTRLENGQQLYIRGDVAQLNQVLVNLLTNAYDASPSDAPIVLRAGTLARDGAPMLDLAVIDRGSGIPPEIRERLFEPLFTTKRSAIGLGLPVVDQVVRAHGGIVRLRTELGKGSEFHVLLPLHRAGG